MKGFRDFLNQGNVVQLAVAVVIGVAFGMVVSALVADIINPIIAIPFGKPNFDSLAVKSMAALSSTAPLSPL